MTPRKLNLLPLTCLCVVRLFHRLQLASQCMSQWSHGCGFHHERDQNQHKGFLFIGTLLKQRTHKITQFFYLLSQANWPLILFYFVVIIFFGYMKQKFINLLPNAYIYKKGLIYMLCSWLKDFTFLSLNSFCFKITCIFSF